MKNMPPNLLNYIEDMNSFFTQQKENLKVVSEKKEPVIFKEDWKRIEGLKDRMARRHNAMPFGKRRYELEALTNAIAYMLSKFEVIDSAEVMRASLERTA